MQFYIIHEDPKTNAKLLPDYCLKKVNLREGWQMISDIGYLYGIKWEGQNKMYNPYHAETRQYWKSPVTFRNFIDHYVTCLGEYIKRFDKKTVWHYRFTHFIGCDYYTQLYIKIKEEPKSQIVKYLLDRKRKHLTEEEIKRLEEM